MSDFFGKYRQELDKEEISPDFISRTERKMKNIRDSKIASAKYRYIGASAAAAACIAASVVFVLGRDDSGLAADTDYNTVYEQTDAFITENTDISQTTVTVPVTESVTSVPESEQTAEQSASEPAETTDFVTETSVQTTQQTQITSADDVPQIAENIVTEQVTEQRLPVEEETSAAAQQTDITEQETASYGFTDPADRLTQGFSPYSAAMEYDTQGAAAVITPLFTEYSEEGETAVYSSVNISGTVRIRRLISDVALYAEDGTHAVWSDMPEDIRYTVEFTAPEKVPLIFYAGTGFICCPVMLNTGEYAYYVYELTDTESNYVENALYGYVS